MSRDSEGHNGIVELDVPEDLEVFAGHFPGNPLFPGVLQIEAAAQATLWVHKGVIPPGAPLMEGVFVAVESFKFKLPVVPPAVLSIHVKQVHARGLLRFWSAELKVKGAVVSKGTYWLRISEKATENPLK